VNSGDGNSHDHSTINSHTYIVFVVGVSVIITIMFANYYFNLQQWQLSGNVTICAAMHTSA